MELTEKISKQVIGAAYLVNGTAYVIEKNELCFVLIMFISHIFVLVVNTPFNPMAGLPITKSIVDGYGAPCVDVTLYFASVE